jgi:BirA family biotin operon repressor/biotin-[acetyl-CoA-carboxylase] ligase
VARALSGVPATHRVAVTESTMDLLHRLAADGADSGTIVVAGEQTAGRGSRGRDWHSPPGGLWLSVLYRPPTAAGIELLSLRVGLAAAEAIEALGPGLPVDLKWPNDLMVGDRKLGGVLCEARWQGESLAWAVAGVGLNVANTLPSGLGPVATTICEHLQGVTPDRVEAELAPRLRSLGWTGEHLEEWELALLRRRDWLSGRRLREPVRGTAAGISEDGALLIQADGGATVAARAGPVELADRSLRA